MTDPLAHLSETDRIRARKLLEALAQRQSENRIDTYYPDEGPLRRELYKKHIQFMSSHEKHRGALGGNRVGKTDLISYNSVVHMTGEYPEWWTGRRYKTPVHVWFGDTSNEQARDVLQLKILGTVGNFGTGLVRKSLIARTPTMKRGMADAVDSFYVKHKYGTSIGWFKSYEQGREAWQGAAVHIIALNEEPPEDVYSEATMRTMTLDGEVISAMTPMLGLSKVVREYLNGNRFYVNIGWEDAPHLSAQQKSDLEKEIPPHERDARMRGLPMIGRGAVYQIDQNRITCNDRELPSHWPRAYGMDVGWNATACVWGAIDRETDILYIYSEYEEGHLEPAQHAQSIRSRGDMVGYIDPASDASGQKDGDKLFEEYTAKDIGLRLEKADNAREAGIFELWKRMTSGRLRIFKSCHRLLDALRLYHRDKNGKIVKENDHLPDALRYLSISAPLIRHIESRSGHYAELNGVRYLSSIPRRNVSLHEAPQFKRAS
ncbi:MAG: terminase family protein [Candidatus Micrarchaeota archaeon]|nr:terminase family protein [Candidatus Micrarchaeota archaeon]